MRLKLKVNWRRNYSLIRDQGNVNKPLDFQNEKIIIANYEYGKKLSQKRNLWSQQQILNLLWNNAFFTIFPSSQNFQSITPFKLTHSFPIQILFMNHLMNALYKSYHQRDCLKKVSSCTVKVGGCILKRNVVH